MKPLIYIAGPISATTVYQMEQNIRRAEDEYLWLIANGFAAVCVHSTARFIHGVMDERIFVDADLVLLERCDAVRVLTPYHQSAGTLRELAHAALNALPVFETRNELTFWRDNYARIKNQS